MLAHNGMEHLSSQEGIIKSVENGQAAIELNGQILRWPTDQLPQPINQGDRVKILVTTAELESMDREKLAKTILNEILSGEEAD